MEELGVARIAEPNFSFLTLHLKNRSPAIFSTDSSDFSDGRLWQIWRTAPIRGLFLIPSMSVPLPWQGKWSASPIVAA